MLGNIAGDVSWVSFSGMIQIFASYQLGCFWESIKGLAKFKNPSEADLPKCHLVTEF